MNVEFEKASCGCQQDGLAIFPVRYTVIPTYLNNSKPSWAQLDDVTTIPLNNDYQYHIRRVRAGFIYIYLPPYNDEPETELSSSDENCWLVYNVDEQGRFVKQFSPQAAKATEIDDDVYKCPNLSSNPTLTSFITIPSPWLYDKVYIAYSEFVWTDEMMRECRKSPLPRMQEINIKTWREQKQQQSATIATQHSLNEILDLNFDFMTNLALPDNQNGNQIYPDEYKDEEECKAKAIFYKEINRETNFNSRSSSYGYLGVSVGTTNTSLKYVFKKEKLKLNSTSQPWIPFRRDDFVAAPGEDTLSFIKKRHELNLHVLHKNMQDYSADNSAPMILAVEDALGVAQDLNNYYNDIYGHLNQFEKDAKMECDVKQCMTTIRTFVESEVAKKDFEIAPYKDELYKILDEDISIDDHDYQQQQLEDRLKTKYPPFSQNHVANIPAETRAIALGIDMNEIKKLAAPLKREFYNMVRSYILLVKDHFYGKPMGHLYYEKFMNYLKFGCYENDPYNITRQNNPSYPELKDYYPNTIYEKIHKYSSFKLDASSEETKKTTLILHNVYQDLVNDYDSKREQYKAEFDQKVNKALEKYTKRLKSDDFDSITEELNKEVDEIANERAKQLIHWLEKGHYVLTLTDLTFEDKIEIEDQNQNWKEFSDKIAKESQEALDKEEITNEEFEELKTIDINGFYCQSVFAQTMHGLDACKTGQEFTQKLFDLQQLKDINVDSVSTYIKLRKTHILKFALPALFGGKYKSTRKVLQNIYSVVDSNEAAKYEERLLTDLKIKGLSFLTGQVRNATQLLEYINKLENLKNKAALRTITLDTSLGKKTFLIKYLTNYDKTGFVPSKILKIYDNLIKRCTPLGDGLYSLGAMIAETAALALSGTIWKMGAVYAHLKYQLFEAWTTFKSQCAPGVNIGGGLKLVSNAYPAQVKKLIKDLRSNLNNAIKMLDERRVFQLIEIEAFFKKTLNIPFKIFSDATTKNITRNQIHLRSARLAFLVGAFEVYTWQYVMDKKPSLFANENDILMEKMAATSSLIAAASDFTAYASRALSVRTSVFVYSKLTFGIFTGFVSFVSGSKMVKNFMEQLELGNYLSALCASASASGYFVSGSAFWLLGLSYRYAWVQTFFEPKVSSYIARKGVQKVFNLVAMRTILLRFAGIVGIIALVLELMYDYFADDEIQVWITYSALGICKGELKFHSYFDQAEAFKKIDMLFNVIQEKTGGRFLELDKKSIDNMKQDYEDVLLKAQNMVHQWISQD